jgi:phage recombination protein Bet
MDNEIVKQDKGQASQKMSEIAKVTEKEILNFLDVFGFKDLAETEKKQFLQVCLMNGLNPFKKEVYIVAYGSGQYRQFSIIIAYQKFIERANNTRLLAGWQISELQKCISVKIVNEKPVESEDYFCEIKIYRKDFSQPILHRVYLSEYIKKTKDGNVTEFWLKPNSQLKKVAISQGMKLVFPDNFAINVMSDAEVILPAEFEDVTNQKSLSAKKPEKPILPENILSEITGKLENFEIPLKAVNKYADTYSFTKEQKEIIKKSGTIGDKELSEIVEMVRAGKKDLIGLEFVLNPAQMKFVVDNSFVEVSDLPE